jgi:hypothetical protein
MAQTFIAGLNQRGHGKAAVDPVRGALVIPSGTLAARLGRQLRRFLDAYSVGFQASGRTGRASVAADAAIAADNTLTTGQRRVLLGLYEDFSAENRRSGTSAAVVRRDRRTTSPRTAARGRHRRPRTDAVARHRGDTPTAASRSVHSTKDGVDPEFHDPLQQNSSPDGPMPAFPATRADGLVAVTTPVRDQPCCDG